MGRNLFKQLPELRFFLGQESKEEPPQLTDLKRTQGGLVKPWLSSSPTFVQTTPNYFSISL